jgi:hypothetical protein
MYFPLLLGYAQTSENPDGNHPPVWIPNAMYFGVNSVHPAMEVSYGNAAPTSGTWTIGSRVWNTNPTNNIAEWICTAAGTPGTWQAVYWTAAQPSLPNIQTLQVNGTAVTPSSQTVNLAFGSGFSVGTSGNTATITSATGATYPAQVYATNTGPISASVSITQMVGGSPAGAQYQLSWNGSAVNGNTGCAGGSVGVYITYTDAASGVAGTEWVPVQYNGGTTFSSTGGLPTGASALNFSTNQWRGLPFTIQPASGTNVSWSTAYTAGTGCTTAQQYQVAVSLVRLQ